APRLLQGLGGQPSSRHERRPDADPGDPRSPVPILPPGGEARTGL
ncbi:MAG: hypothetical protein AVDCRST_MAG02-1238, partial [uncultured Rubrobacteraceae bacterium]